MKNILLFIIVVLVIIILGLGYWFFFKSANTSSISSMNQESECIPFTGINEKNYDRNVDNHLQIENTSNNMQAVSFREYCLEMTIPFSINNKRVTAKNIETPIGSEFVYEGNDFYLAGEQNVFRNNLHIICTNRLVDDYTVSNRNDICGQAGPKVGTPYIIDASSRGELTNWGVGQDDTGTKFMSFATDKISCVVNDGGPFKLEMINIKIK